MMRSVCNYCRIFAVFAVCTVTLYGKTWYVAGGGNDETGGQTPDAAFATLSKARSSAKSGDTIFLKRGDMFRGAASPPLWE